MSIKDFKELTISSDKQVYVVGDIHMKTEPLYKALEALSFNTNNDILVSVGDLIDRGPNAPECILELLNQPWFYSVLGNHEDMFLKHLMFGGTDSQMFLYNGGDWILNSDSDIVNKLFNKFIELPIAIQINYMNKQFGIVHAGVYFDDWQLMKENLIAFKENDMFARHDIISHSIWDRRQIKFDNLIKNIDYAIFGHNPLKETLIKQNKFYIDTASVYNNKLTILKLSDMSTHSF